MVEVMAKAVAEALVTRWRGDGVGEAAEVRGERRERRWRRAGGSPRRARLLALAMEVLVALVEVMATVMTAMAYLGWGGEDDATTAATRRLFGLHERRGGQRWARLAMAGAHICVDVVQHDERVERAHDERGSEQVDDGGETVVRFSFWCDKSPDRAEEGDHEEGV